MWEFMRHHMSWKAAENAFVLYIVGLKNFRLSTPCCSSYITVIRINDLLFDPLQCLRCINPVYKITQVLHWIPGSTKHLNAYFETRLKDMFKKKQFLMALVNWGLNTRSRSLLKETMS